MTTVTLSVETNAEYYTGEEDDEQYIDALTNTIAEKASLFMSKNYPNVAFDVRFVSESMSYGNKSLPREEGDDGYDELQALNDYIGTNLCDWWASRSV